MGGIGDEHMKKSKAKEERAVGKRILLSGRFPRKTDKHIDRHVHKHVNGRNRKAHRQTHKRSEMNRQTDKRTHQENKLTYVRTQENS